MANHEIPAIGRDSELFESGAGIIFSEGVFCRLGEFNPIEERGINFVNLYSLQEEMASRNLPFDLPRQLVFSPENLYERWREQGGRFSEEQIEELGEWFESMLKQSLTESVAIRRWITMPGFSGQRGDYPPGPTYNELRSVDECLWSSQEMFQFYNTAFPQTKDFKAGLMVTEWADPPYMDLERIDRYSSLPRAGYAYVVDVLDDGFVVEIQGLMGEHAVLQFTKDMVPRDTWRIKVFPDGTMRRLTEDRVMKNKLFLQRNSRPSTTAERLGDESRREVKESAVWKVPLPAECIDLPSLHMQEILPMAALTVELTKRLGKTMRIEFSLGQKVDLQGSKVPTMIVNQASEWHPAREVVRIEDTRYGGVVMSIAKAKEVRRLETRLVKSDDDVIEEPWVYISPETGLDQHELSKIFSKLQRIREKLVILITGSELNHRGRQVSEIMKSLPTFQHEVLFIENMLGKVDLYKYVKAVPINGNGIYRVEQAEFPFGGRMGQGELMSEVGRLSPVISLQDAIITGKFKPSEVGGKAVGLIELIQNGCESVLPGVILTEGFLKNFLTDYGLWEKYCGLKTIRNKKEMINLFSEIFKGLEPTEAPDNSVRKNLQEIRELLGLSSGQTVSVRSNASIEDRDPLHSFAGHFESQLNVMVDDEKLYSAIHTVIREYFKKNVAEMLKSRFTIGELGKMMSGFGAQVLIQPMLDSSKVTASGVGFSLTSREEVMQLDLDIGLAGGVNTAAPLTVRYHRDRDCVTAWLLGHKVMLGKGALEEAFEDSSVEKRWDMIDPALKEMVKKLDSDTIKGFFGMMWILEARLGWPVDIEVAFTTDGMVLLQQRPLPRHSVS